MAIFCCLSAVFGLTAPLVGLSMDAFLLAMGSFFFRLLDLFVALPCVLMLLALSFFGIFVSL